MWENLKCLVVGLILLSSCSAKLNGGLYLTEDEMLAETFATKAHYYEFNNYSHSFKFGYCSIHRCFRSSGKYIEKRDRIILNSDTNFNALPISCERVESKILPNTFSVKIQLNDTLVNINRIDSIALEVNDTLNYFYKTSSFSFPINRESKKIRLKLFLRRDYPFMSRWFYYESVSVEKYNDYSLVVQFPDNYDHYISFDNLVCFKRRKFVLCDTLHHVSFYLMTKKRLKRQRELWNNRVLRRLNSE